MPSKPTSHEAAQRREWAKEIRDLEKQGNAIKRDFRKELNASLAKTTEAKKASDNAQKEHLRLASRLATSEASQLKAINSRIAKLKGRLGH